VCIEAWGRACLVQKHLLLDISRDGQGPEGMTREMQSVLSREVGRLLHQGRRGGVSCSHCH
jgi:hypothetical protein